MNINTPQAASAYLAAAAIEFAIQIQANNPLPTPSSLSINTINRLFHLAGGLLEDAGSLLDRMPWPPNNHASDLELPSPPRA